MKASDFAKALMSLPNVSELSVYSDGGYCYRVVDSQGKDVSVAELGIKWTVIQEGYARIDGDIYNHTATIRQSDDIADDKNVRTIDTEDNKTAVVIHGDIN